VRKKTSTIRTGTKVQFKIGRGTLTGRVEMIKDGVAIIVSSGRPVLSRKLALIKRA
jgi:hypothetical protein